MKWKIKPGMWFRKLDGTLVGFEGQVFEATPEEVLHMEYAVEPVKEEPVKEEEPQSQDVPKKRRGRPPKNRSLSSPPFTTAF